MGCLQNRTGSCLFSGRVLQAQLGAHSGAVASVDQDGTWPEAAADGRVGCGAAKETTMGRVAHAAGRLKCGGRGGAVLPEAEHCPESQAHHIARDQ